MGEWATTIGIIGGGLLGVLAAWIAKSTGKQSLDERFMEKLMRRVEQLEKQNAEQAEQIQQLTSDLAKERGTVRELLRDIAELKHQIENRGKTE